MEIVSPRRQSLTIEARHTMSLEAAKQRRLKVASSLFLPSKPVRHIIPISIEHEKPFVYPKKKARKTKKERLDLVEETLVEPKETEKNKKRPRKRTPSVSEELQKEEEIPSKQILFFTDEVEIDNWLLTSPPNETLPISSEPAKEKKHKSLSCKEVVSTTKTTIKRSCKEETSSDKDNISEVSKALTKSTSSKVSKERKSWSYKPVFRPSSESRKGKDYKSSSPKEISSSSTRKKEIERKYSTSYLEKGQAVICKDIVTSSRKENDGECWKRHNTNNEESLDKYNISEKPILSERVSSSEYQVEIEAEILPTTTTADRTAEEFEAEVLPTTTTTERTVEKFEAEVLPTTTTTDRTAEKFEAQILPTTTTADRTEEQFEAEVLPTTTTTTTESTEDKFEAEVLPTTTTTDRTAEKVKAEILPSTTTTDRTEEKFETEVLPTTTSTERTEVKFEAEVLPTNTTTYRAAEKFEAEILPTTTTTYRTAGKFETEVLPKTTSTERIEEKFEAKVLPTSTTTDRTAEKFEAEVLPTTTTTERTEVKFEAEVLPTTTTTDITAETLEAEVLPTTTTTDRTENKVEILSKTIIEDSRKRSPLKQILFRTRISELEMSNLFEKGSTETFSRARKINEQMETARAAEEMIIADKETNNGVYILTTDPNGSKQCQVPKPHFVSKTTPQYKNSVQYYQGVKQPQATSMQMPTNMCPSATDQSGVHGYEGPGLPHTKNTIVQKSSTNQRKCTSEEHIVRHRSRTDASDKVEYITRYYNDKPMNCGIRLPRSCSNLYGLNDMRFIPYDLSQRSPREYIQPPQLSPELPSAACHNQQQLNQGPVPAQAHPANSQPNFMTDWVASMNTQNQIALANTVIQPAQDTCPNNLPQWLQQSINNFKLNSPAINIPVPMVHPPCHQTPAFHEHPTQADMGRWIQPLITQAPFEPMNQHPPMQRCPNHFPSYQMYNSPFNNQNLMQHVPEMPATMGCPNIIQGCNSWCPVQMNSPSGKRERSMLGAHNSQPQIRHEEAPRPLYSAPSIYQADSTTGGNSPPLPSTNMPGLFIEPLNHYPSHPIFYKPVGQPPPQSQLPYSRVNNYPPFGHGHGTVNNMPEYDPRRNR